MCTECDLCDHVYQCVPYVSVRVSFVRARLIWTQLYIIYIHIMIKWIFTVLVYKVHFAVSSNLHSEFWGVKDTWDNLLECKVFSFPFHSKTACYYGKTIFDAKFCGVIFEFVNLVGIEFSKIFCLYMEKISWNISGIFRAVSIAFFSLSLSCLTEQIFLSWNSSAIGRLLMSVLKFRQTKIAGSQTLQRQNLFDTIGVFYFSIFTNWNFSLCAVIK